MGLQATLHRQLSERTAFWVVFLMLVLVCLGFILPGTFRRRDASRTCEILSSLFSADARFKTVTVSASTSGRAILSGSVASEKDAAALRSVVEQAHPPQRPVLFIRVLTSTTNEFR